MTDTWYYGRGSERIGPISLDELRARLSRDGKLSEAHVWREGFDTWKRAPEVPELYPVEPPPLPALDEIASISTVRMQDQSVAPKEESGWRKAAGIAASLGGAVIGIALSKALGATFWIPAAAIGCAWWALSKLKAPSWAVPMLAIVIGHTTWIIVGVVILIGLSKTTEDNFLSLLDIAIVTGLTWWVLKAQSKASCIGVLVFEIFALVVNITNTGDGPAWLTVAMIVHMLLRLCGIVACGYALYKRRPKESLTPQTI